MHLSDVKVLVVCPNGHKFPVNLDKHTNRDHVFCPKCKAKVVVRKKHVFSPSPTWGEEKREGRILRAEVQRVRSPAPVMSQSETFHRDYMRRALGALAFSKLVKKREEELKRGRERED